MMRHKLCFGSTVAILLSLILSGVGFAQQSKQGGPKSQSARELDKTVALRMQRFVTFNFACTSPAKLKIRTALDSPTTLQFVETPLTDVVDFLKDFHAIPIVLDSKALDDVGIGTDTPVSIDVAKISLRSGLNLMLADLDLDYVCKDEVLVLTTKEVTEASLETVVYSLHLLDHKPDELAKVIESTIKPGTWRTGPDADPKRTIGAVKPLGETLVVTHNRHAHDAITRLLHQLHRQQKAVGEYLKLRDGSKPK